MYSNTQKFFYTNLIIYLVGFFIPLIVQMEIGEDLQTPLIMTKVFWINFSCLIVQVYFLVYEVVQLRNDGFREYFSDQYNTLEYS